MNLIASITNDPTLWAAVVFCGLSVGAATWTVISIVTCHRPDSLHPFELRRRDRLRKSDPWYKYAEPLVGELGQFAKRYSPGLLQQLSADLPLTGHDAEDASEFVGLAIVRGMLYSAVLCLLMAVAQPKLAVAAAVLLPIVLVTFHSHSVATAARLYRRRVRLRLPFAVDLIALMMEAGSGFRECLATIVQEEPGHPLSGEFALILNNIDHGRLQHEALESLDQRMGDSDVSELVFAVNRGSELGTPLSQILRDQSSQMQQKRAQWGEIAAADAEIKMVFPGLLVMVACLLIIVATFLLPAREFF